VNFRDATGHRWQMVRDIPANGMINGPYKPQLRAPQKSIQIFITWFSEALKCLKAFFHMHENPQYLITLVTFCLENSDHSALAYAFSRFWPTVAVVTD
jgi:hypothetical protein